MERTHTAFRRGIFFALAAILLAAILLAGVATAQTEPPPPIDLVAVPYPDMTNLEQAVKDQLNEAHGDLEAWLQQESPSAADLVNAFGRLGQLLHAYELFDAAEACYRNALTLDSKNFLWPYLLGHVFQKKGEFELAAQAYQHSLGLEPRNLAAGIHLGEVFMATNAIEEAEKMFRQVLEASPDVSVARAHLGEMALARGDHEEAVELLTSVLEQVPGANRLNYPLAMAYRGLGEMDKAREHLAKNGVVGLTVDDPLIDAIKNLATGERVHLLEGRKAFNAGRYGEAAGEFRKAMAADPRSARVRVNLGSALGQLGDKVGAEEQFRVALALDPDNVTALFNLGVIRADQGDFEGAASHFRAAIGIKYDDGETHYRLGRVLHRLGQREEALASLRSATGLIPTTESLWVDAAKVAIELERYQEALEFLEEGYRIMPASGAVSHALSRILAGGPDPQLRDGKRALALAQRVFEARQSPGHAATVAMALAELGRCKEAAQWLGEAVRGAGEQELTDWIAAQEATLSRYQAGAPCN